MIQNYSDQRSQSYKKAKLKRNKKKCYGNNSRIICKIWGKFVKFVNYSGIIRSKFGQPNNSAFNSSSPNKRIIHESCDYVHGCFSIFFVNKL